jgi:hypothetical protein
MSTSPDAAPGPVGAAPSPVEGTAGVEPQQGEPQQGKSQPPDATPDAWQTLALTEVGQRRAELLAEITTLEERRRQIEQELASSFAGQADAVARRLKGFQDYLVGALQDLAASAEQIELVAQPLLVQPSPLDQTPAVEVPPPPAVGLFSQDEDLIRERLEGFSGQPDFQAEPWQLRRTLEASGAQLLEQWFIDQGGRGAQPSSGSRLRNGVVTAAAIIMIAVFGGFIFSHTTMIQPVGFGLAVGVLIDAFLVRLVLVPAALKLIGPAAWWLPKWLDKILPDVDVEGAKLERSVTHA